MKSILPAVGCIITAFVAAATAARAESDFPLTGSYTQNVPCKGDGSDPADLKVKISPAEIVSGVGTCLFLETTQHGSTINAHVECQFPGGPLMGDITFTMRPDKTVEFIDRDKTYSALLHRCPD